MIQEFHFLKTLLSVLFPCAHLPMIIAGNCNVVLDEAWDRLKAQGDT